MRFQDTGRIIVDTNPFLGERIGDFASTETNEPLTDGNSIYQDRVLGFEASWTPDSCYIASRRESNKLFRGVGILCCRP